jgi:RNA polymerase sigma factor (sigma-70 family)
VSEGPEWAELPDRDLVRRAVSPSSPQERESALRAIYDRHSGDVLGLCGWWLGDPDAALDAAQSTFEAAIADLTASGRTGAPTIRDPDKLGAWLCGIARNLCRAEWRRRNLQGEFPADLEDAEHEVIASRRRQAQVDRMLGIVAASLNERQQAIFRLVYQQGMRGQALAAAMGFSEKDANDATLESRRLAFDGFGAYVLARDGRAYCSGLARILDQAAWDGQTFTRVLRLRILRHLDNCQTCDNCATCNVQKRKLVKLYAPVLIPILIAAELRYRIYNFIHRICTPPATTAPGDEDADGQRQKTAAKGATVDAVLEAVISRPPESPGHGRRRTHRPRRRRHLRTLGRRAALLAAVTAVIIAGILIVPRMLAGSHPPSPSSAGQAPPAQLAGASSQVWHLTPWTIPGVPPAGASQWRFLGNCAQASACTYTLQVVKFKTGPDVWYAPLGGARPAEVLRLHAVSGGYQGVGTFSRICLGNTKGPLLTLRNSVDIKITGSVETRGRSQANKIAIVWTFSTVYSPPADQAAGCKENSYTYTAQATLGT